jgi:hypothetical protein
MFIKKNDDGSKTLTFLSSAVLSVLLVVSIVSLIANAGIHIFDLDIKTKTHYEQVQ